MHDELPHCGPQEHADVQWSRHLPATATTGWFQQQQQHQQTSGHQCSRDCAPEWEFIIGVPGQYNSSAFCCNPSGSADLSPVPLRELVLTQLRPSTYEDKKTGKVYRRYVEDVSLQYRDGSQRLATQLGDTPQPSVL
jgi:hypothetical protein